MEYLNIIDEISYKKSLLSATDYQAIKHSEGFISDEEYEDIKAQRQEWRDHINELEALLPEAEEEYNKKQEAIRLAKEQARAEEEARMQEEMEQAMAKQEDYEKDFEAFQNGDMSWDEFSAKYPEMISNNEGEDYTDIIEDSSEITEEE